MYKFQFLSADDRKTIAEGQARQFEAEIFGHQLNLARLQALPDDDTSADESKTQAAIDVIASAIAVTTAVIEDLAAAAQAGADDRAADVAAQEPAGP